MKGTVKATPTTKASPTTKATCTMKAIHTAKATKIMNTHPTHAQVGGWGLRPPIVPLGVGDLLLLLLHV